MTVSTVGVIPRLLQMADDMPGVRCVLAGWLERHPCQGSAGALFGAVAARDLAASEHVLAASLLCTPGSPRHPARLHCAASLALSLHAPTQELRQTIVPSAKVRWFCTTCACVQPALPFGCPLDVHRACHPLSLYPHHISGLSTACPPQAFKLDRLMAAVDTYQQRTKQRVFVEYVMLGPGERGEAKHQGPRPCMG